LPGVKSGLVLGVLSGSSKEIKTASLDPRIDERIVAHSTANLEVEVSKRVKAKNEVLGLLELLLLCP
jgi:hypothetical protein